MGKVVNLAYGLQHFFLSVVITRYRFGPDNVFDPSEDYTRLTFDTIALCSMSHR